MPLIYTIEFAEQDNQDTFVGFSFQNRKVAKWIYYLITKYNKDSEYKINLVINNLRYEDSQKSYGTKENDKLETIEDSDSELVYFTITTDHEQTGKDDPVVYFKLPEDIAVGLQHIQLNESYEYDHTIKISFNKL
jgi:hypothetical protein